MNKAMNLLLRAALPGLAAAALSAQTVDFSPVNLDGTQPVPGRTFTATLRYPPRPGAVYTLAFDPFASPLPIRLPGIGELGLALSPAFGLLRTATLDRQGTAAFSVGLPSAPNLLGVRFHLQALVYTNASPRGAFLSNLYAGDIVKPASHTPVPGAARMPRAFATATVLQDGRVLIVGGGNGSLTAPGAIQVTEFYYPWSKRFDYTRTPQGTQTNLTTARVMHTATRLNDGRVLIAGGFDAQGNVLRTAEVFNPTTGRFTPVGSLNRPRGTHTATRLPDGRVLLAGGTTASFTYPNVFGSATNTTEIFDPTTNRFQTGPSMLARRMLHGAVPLRAGGRDYVLMVSGIKGLVLFVLPDYTATAEVYDVKAGAFSSRLGGRPIAALKTRRALFGAALQPNGRVLVAGGVTGSIPAATRAAEEFNPATAGWSALPSLPTARAAPAVALLSTGKLLIQGGAVGSLTAPSATASSYLFSGGAFSPTAPLKTARGLQAAVVLKSGVVLALGGGDRTGKPLATAEYYTP